MKRTCQLGQFLSGTRFLVNRTRFLVLALTALCTSTAHAQTPWIGTPAFSTQLASETDSINPANLNVHLVFPIFAKPGRGMTLSYVRSKDSLVWMVVKTDPVNNIWSWVPVASNSGFSGDGVFGSVTWSQSSNTCGQQGGTWITRTDYVYHDPSGTSHSFPGVNVPVQTCNGFQFPGLTATSPDGSGYRLVLGAAPTLSASVIGMDGTTAGTSSTSGAPFLWQTDPNGNQITSVTAGFTDTLGTSSVHFSPVGANPSLVTYPQPGNPTNYIGAAFAYSNYTVKTNFGCQGRNEYGPWTTPLITTITLADGSYYAFTYEPTPGYPGDTTGRLASVRFPSGATISYTYTGANGGINCYDGSLMGLQRVTPDGTWTYTRSGGGTTLVDPQGNQTIFDFTILTNTNGWSDTVIFTGSSMETRRRIYQGSATLLKTVETCYNGAAFPCTATPITLPITRTTVRTELPDSSGLVSQLDTYLDSNIYSLVTEKDEYDFGTGGPPATPVRKTLTTYATFGSNPNIKDRPLTVTVQDGSGNVKAQTTYAYDETAVTATTGTPQHVSVTGSRGNPTTITYLVQGATTVHRTKSYYDTGTVNVETDLGQNPTTYAYGAGSCGNSFPTQVTDALNHIRSMTWDCNGGVLTSATDENSKTTSYVFGNSYFWLLTQVNNPDGGQATATYNLGGNSPWNTIQTIKATSSLILSKKTVFDSLARVSQRQITSDPQGTTYVDTTYDNLGRTSTVSNPYRSTSEATYGITTTRYDSVGRVTKVIPPDGTDTANNISTVYAQNCSTVTDQAGKIGKSCSDGLGRLTQVFEPDASNNLVNETDYWYDTLSNLRQVQQKGNDPNSANWRTRTFVYDDLSRLTSATNPETGPATSSGTIIYKYDQDTACATPNSFSGLLISKVDSRGIRTCMLYDALNRITQKNYSDSTPVVNYGYDGIAPTGCTLPTLTIHNGIGKRTGMCDAAGAEAWSWDITTGVGWMTTDARTTGGVTKNTIYQDNFDGSLASLTYPSGRVITYALQASGSNTAGRFVSATDSTGPINYAAAALYAPQGAFSYVQNGAGFYSTFLFNKRLQPCWLYANTVSTGAPASCTQTGVATAAIIDFQYDFGLSVADNGNVNRITNRRNTSRSITYQYDELNRIKDAVTDATSGQFCWGQLFGTQVGGTFTSGYDPWANLKTITPDPNRPGCSVNTLSKTINAYNKIVDTGYGYDSAGNMTVDPGTIATYQYDAEGRLKSASDTLGSSAYLYDGDGRRVAKAPVSQPTQPNKIYWYGTGSDPLDETDSAGSISNSAFNEYIFFGGKRIARRNYLNNIFYYFTDHLGTSRAIVQAGQTAPCYDADFYPFGGEAVIVTNTCSQNYKFTGKERDSESGLDNFGARYNSSALGRFLSPDSPGMDYANLLDPQQRNLYSYTRNNPLSFVDRAGRQAQYWSAPPVQVATATWSNFTEVDGGTIWDLIVAFGSGLIFERQRASYSETRGVWPTPDVAVNFTPIGSGGGETGTVYTKYAFAGRKSAGLHAEFTETQVTETTTDSEGVHTRTRSVINVALWWGRDLVGFGGDLFAGGAVQTVGGRLPDPQVNWFGHFGGVRDEQMEPLRQELQTKGYSELAYQAQVEEGRRNLQNTEKKKKLRKPPGQAGEPQPHN